MHLWLAKGCLVQEGLTFLQAWELFVNMDHSRTGLCISFVRQSQLVHMIRVQERAEVLKASSGWGLELAHHHLPLILLVEVNHKASSDFKGGEINSTYQQEEMKNRITKVWPQGEGKE